MCTYIGGRGLRGLHLADSVRLDLALGEVAAGKEIAHLYMPYICIFVYVYMGWDSKIKLRFIRGCSGYE